MSDSNAILSLDHLVDLRGREGWQAGPRLRNEVLRLATSDDEGRAVLIEFLRRATPRQWLVLDGSLRMVPASVRSATRLEKILRLIRSREAAGSPDLLSVGLSTMSADGYRRQRAIGQLETIADPLVGAFLALRTIDWVEPVASAARTGLIRRMRADPDIAESAAPLLVATAARKRGGPALAALETIVADNVALQRRLLRNTEASTRRWALAIALDVDASLKTPELVALAVGDPDTVVATRAGQAAVARATRDGDQEILAMLMKGRAPVKAAVLDVLPADIASQGIARGSLFDRSPKVRAAATRLLQRGGADPYEIYRPAAKAGDHRAIAVLELGFSGAPGDVSIVVDALRDPEASIRRAGVLATRWLIIPELPTLMEAMLEDPSPGVVRSVERRLRPWVRDLDRATIDRAIRSVQPHVRRAGYRLLRRRSDQERLEADFIALADTDDGILLEARADLNSWLRRRAARAPRGDLATRQLLASLLTTVDQKLDPSVVERSRFHAALRDQDIR